MLRRFILFACLAVASAAAGQTVFDAGTQLVERIANDTTTGTTVNELAKVTSAGKLIIVGTGDTNIPVFIVNSGAGTTGNAAIASSGAALCKFDAAGGTAGNYVQVSTTVAGMCHDSGTTVPSTNWIVGQLLSSPAANATGLVLLNKGTSAGGLLGCATTGATPSTTIGPLTIAANKQLRIPVYISSYAGGGSTALMTFNSAGGTAYRFRWLTSAAAATTFTSGVSNVPTVSTSGIRLGPDNTTLSRNVVVFITNDPANTEKLVLMEQAIGTGSAATQTALTFGNAAWVSGAATSITSVTLTAGTNMGAGSGFCVYGSTF